MNLPNPQDNSSPSPQQKLLLKAALLQGEEAMNSWQQWSASVDIDDLDSEYYRLLPLLYRNLSAHGVTDMHMARLKGVYRRTWCENQVLLKKITAILRCFQDEGIETLLLKDAVLSFHYYPDSGLRMIHNMGIFVSPSDASVAINLLQKLGFKPQVKISNKVVSLIPALGFENESKQFLELRWGLFGFSLQENADNDFWKRTLSTKINEVSTHILSPTEQLFHTCLYEAWMNPVFPISRLADAALIINGSPDKIEWNRLVAEAQKHHLILPLKTLLTELHQSLNIPVPPSILQEIQTLPISKFERSQSQIMTGEPKTILERLLMRYFLYCRTVNTAAGRFSFLGFPRYLQYIWGLEYLWEVPFQAIIRGMKRLVSVKKFAKSH